MLENVTYISFFGFFPDWSYLNSLGNLVDIIVKSRWNLVQFFLKFKSGFDSRKINK